MCQLLCFDTPSSFISDFRKTKCYLSFLWLNHLNGRDITNDRWRFYICQHVSSITSPNHGAEADFVTQYHFSSPTSGQLQISPYQLAPPVKAFIFLS